MKLLSVRISTGIIALGALSYFLACSPATQDNNSSVSTNKEQAKGNVAVNDPKPCIEVAQPGPHEDALRVKIEGELTDSLRRQLKNQNNPDGTFTIEVQQAANGKYFEGYVRGEVSGDDNLKDLSNILNDFQEEGECLRVVYLIPDRAPPGFRGFRWSSCEHPLVMCPGGECCEPIIGGNTNTTGNSNANANANVNVNANGGGNTNN